MSVGALIVIEKVAYGETWTNTHCGAITGDGGVDDWATVTEENLANIIGPDYLEGYNQFNTDPTSDEWPDTPDLLRSIITFERLIHFDTVRFTRAYITDTKTSPGFAPAFATFPLNFNGLRPSALVTVAPLNNVLQVDRVPSTLSARSGRLQLRAVLQRDQIIPAAGDGVDIQPDTFGSINDVVNLAVTNSGLNTWFFTTGPVVADQVLYVIPQYNRTGLTGPIGSIGSCTRVRALSVDGAASRQVPKGRKERTTTTTASASAKVSSLQAQVAQLQERLESLQPSSTREPLY